MNFFYVLLLGVAVSIDGLMAGVAYGLRSIRIPLSSFLIVGAVTAVASAFAMGAAAMLGQYIDTFLAMVLGGILLILLGAWNVFHQYLTKNIPTYEVEGEVTAGKLTFSIGHLVISIMARPESADVDHLGVISPLEAVFLGLAVGADAAVGTFAAALTGALPLYTPLIIGIIHIICIGGGVVLSDRFVSDEWKRRFPFLPGTMLIVLGLLRLA
ncbi:manganese efflux pump [Anaerosporomusa subterranea]|nr:manganese efflux pump [Anaerosporomusa subterranea]